jgi:hypothetical protein
MDSLQGKQNNADELTNGKQNNNTAQSVEPPKMDDGNQGGTPKEGEQRVETPIGDEPQLEMAKMDGDLPTVQTTTNKINGQEEHLQEIRLD